MERLTKRNSDGSVGIAECRYYNYEDFQKLARKLADYEDKQEQGLLIELPCKVGDTMYYIYGKEIVEVNVLRIEISYTEIHIVTGYNSLGKIGKTLFFTRSEAEESLAKMGGK